jgi:hypothetical protein
MDRSVVQSRLTFPLFTVHSQRTALRHNFLCINSRLRDNKGPCAEEGLSNKLLAALSTFKGIDLWYKVG